MQPYTPADNFPDIDILSISDPVLGGTGGESNLPLEALADRTQWLYNRRGIYSMIRTITSAASVTATDVFKMLYITQPVTVTVDACGTFPEAATLVFKCTCPAGKAVTITSASNILDGSSSSTTVWLCDGEELWLVNTGSVWLLLPQRGNFDRVAQHIECHLQPKNTVLADGTLYNRSDYPRLWNAVKDIAINDGTWLSYINNGFFSVGNGSTTFRVPDFRGMFIRCLDLGRGMDTGRVTTGAGGYEDDAFKSHSHKQGSESILNNYGGGNFVGTRTYPAGGTNSYNDQNTSSVGSTETRPKNIAFPAFIYY